MQLTKSTYQTYKYLAISSFALAILGGAIMLQPLSFGENANAETATDSTSLDMSATLDPVIAIWTTDTSNVASSQVNISASPDESVATGSLRAHVSTNNLTGYTLTIQSNSTNAQMIHESGSISATINPLTGSGTSASSWASNSSLNNKWGYSLGSNDSYKGVPGSSSSATTIDETDEPNNDNYTTVTFGAKADLSLPAGTYTDTVIFSAVANAVPTPITDGMNMQDVTQQVCADTPLYSESSTTYTLIDSRDNTNYEVRRLADGNCWMTNNLKLTRETISAAGKSYVLDSSNTDLSGSTTFTVPADTSTFSTSSYTTAQIHTSGNATYGAYYSWPAAIADDTGTAHNTQYDNMPNSICPKHWDLPTGQGSSTYSYNNQWYAMLVTGYGLKDYTETSSTTGNPTDFTTGAYNLPFSGFWNDSSASSQGGNGNFWASTVYDAVSTYNGYINNTGVLRAGTDNSPKCAGLSVRCLVQAAS